MVQLVKLATCSLDQWALDFSGNTERIRSSIKDSKQLGARYRLGPELEISGYGCEDHFFEHDTLLHSWEALASLIADADLSREILIDVGMPVLYNGARYNCRVFILDQQILLIRPKMILADDGNYRESRWFSAWSKPLGAPLESIRLPKCLQDILGQDLAPFGVAVLNLRDARIASESCEEVFATDSPNVYFALAGVDILGNGSGSHHQLRKLNKRVTLMENCTSKAGGIYMYANQQGCDGGRLYFDGCAMIIVNGDCVAQGSQFSVKDTDTLVATVDLDDVRSYRASIASRAVQASRLSRDNTPPSISVNFCLSPSSLSSRLYLSPTPIQKVRYHTPEEEIALGPACWLWDYLRRSGAGGFFLPLSGGADSAATCALVAIMCELVRVEIIVHKSEIVLADLRRIVGDSHFLPNTRQDIAERIMHTSYMGTVNSGTATKRRAELLAQEVGAYHVNVLVDAIVAAVIMLFSVFSLSKTGVSRIPRFLNQGGTRTEDLALQNIQARVRMVVSYMLAQLLPWLRSSGSGSWLLVLGSANVDECLRGYMTKYDCSSADINPIGGISKHDLASFLVYAAKEYNMPTLAEIKNAPPSAELRPPTSSTALSSSATNTPTELTASTWAGPVTAQTVDDDEGSIQLDEIDMGMSYEELSWFGRLRKIQRCGPYSMYQKLIFASREQSEDLGGPWRGLSPIDIAIKVKRFFFYYAINRHKATTLTPSYHAESYGVDDNRYDLRPFLYNAKWDVQFKAIDEDVKEREKELGVT